MIHREDLSENKFSIRARRRGIARESCVDQVFLWGMRVIDRDSGKRLTFYLYKSVYVCRWI